MGQYFDILTPPPQFTTPLVIHVPHSSIRIPEDFRAQFTLSAVDLETELIAMTDRYTDELFNAAIHLGGSMLVNQASPCFKKWFGTKPIIDHDLFKAIRKNINS